ncbi:phosphopantetheine binding protein [Defluviimonas denitrificans]|jgi:acyl carrier protein|uniref:Phosphopantetheine binding protein n=1 Tax=Albidovulum denitrificans TaxID=404881 RepID=A0A2S8S5M3_9RHOB|nr:phosphopantetheine-binding protein [Defluviimonas denitrificans]MCB1408064.1 acyl carrier protein [Paracoccaceae bacterium]PQV56038.1 phosphopantetheine binding protein [Defluviimonas denitrificans]
MTDYSAQIIEAICEIDETRSPGSLGPQTRFEADLGFDSGSFIELFLILEETVEGFTLGSARLAPEDFSTIQALSDFIVRRMIELRVAA